MLVVIEILAVIAAFMYLVWAGWELVRAAMALGRTGKAVQDHAQTKVMVLMTESDMAQQRTLSISGKADRLQRNVEAMRMSIARLLVIINVFRMASDRISRLQRRLGY